MEKMGRMSSVQRREYRLFMVRLGLIRCVLGFFSFVIASLFDEFFPRKVLLQHSFTFAVFTNNCKTFFDT